MSQTLFDKIWNQHVVTGEENESQLLYIDLHLIHEVSTPQAFEGLRESKRALRRPDLTFATMDHNTPTKDIYHISDVVSKKQIETLERNCKEFNISLFGNGHEKQGIVHLIGPEVGLTQPGKTIVCGDSHTATHGAFGAIGFGIGTSEVEHVFATQTLWQKKPKNMGIKISGSLQKGVFSKDIILYIINKYGVGFGTGYAIEFFGETIENLSMESRMSICNMSIEAGAKIGMIAPDKTTFDYVSGREFAPKDMNKAIDAWSLLKTDNEDAFDQLIEINASEIKPQVTWGTNPGMGGAVDEMLPDIKDENDERAYQYMDLKPGTYPKDIKLGYVFIGSCTNGRLSDLEEAAKMVKHKKIHPNITGIVVPGSRPVKKAAEKLGLDKIFIEAGFEWREPGCSMCLGMNPDQVPEGVHCASTSNRNFEGRQGKGSRTHLCSPAMAAAAAINGQFIDIREESH